MILDIPDSAVEWLRTGERGIAIKNEGGQSV